jgi:hypothetical protein
MAANDEFLDQLVGSWDLRGQMGSTALHPAVEGRWVLDGLFVELRFSELDSRPYEAVYYVGHNEERGLYVLHLLDSTGVYVAPKDTVGIGRLEGAAISFLFGDEAEPFTNRLEWHPGEEEWTFDLTYVHDGEERGFARKRMRRAGRRDSI